MCSLASYVQLPLSAVSSIACLVIVSVALAVATGDYLKSNGYRVSVAHRDLKLAPRAAQE